MKIVSRAKIQTSLRKSPCNNAIFFCLYVLPTSLASHKQNQFHFHPPSSSLINQFRSSLPHFESSSLYMLSLMGVQNSPSFLSEKDLDDMEFKEGEEREEHKGAKRRRVAVGLKIRIPSYQEEEEENGGFKTPTSEVHRITEILECPPAPRKPKSMEALKRKAPRPRSLLDLSKELESLFPSPIVLDLGGKIKKVKQAM